MKPPTTPSAVEQLARIKLAKIEARKAFWRKLPERIYVTVMVSFIIGAVGGAFFIMGRDFCHWISDLNGLDYRVKEIEYQQGRVDAIALQSQRDSAALAAQFLDLQNRVKALEAKPAPQWTIPPMPSYPVFTNAPYFLMTNGVITIPCGGVLTNDDLGRWSQFTTNILLHGL